MGGLLLRLRTWWETADRTQKVVTLFGSAFLVMLLAGSFYFATRPKMAMAYGGLTAADQGKVVAEIQRMGIPVEFDLQGNVKVPSDKVAQVQASLAASGMAPSSGHLGNNDLANINMMSPKAVEEARLTAIREGEIAKTIEVIGGVESARVLLNLGSKGAFAAEDDPPSASVTLIERAGASVGADQAKAIASLVAKAVPGLDPKNVTVVNQSGATLYDGAEISSYSGLVATKIEGQIAEARRIKRELQPILDRAYGPGNSLLTVRVEMNYDQAKERAEKMTAHADPISATTIQETMTGDAAGAGGVAGLGGGAGTTAAGNGTGYKGSHNEVQYPYDRTYTETEKAPGSITSLSLSVLVNSKTVTDTKPVEDVLRGFLGPKANDPNYSVAVTQAEFDDKAAKELQTLAASNSSKEMMQQVFSLLPVVALVLVSFIVLKSLGKTAKSQNVLVQALPDGTLAYSGGGEGAPMIAGSGATASQRSLERAVSAAGHVQAAHQEPVDIGDIQEKLNVPLEQIKKMASEKPAIVAMLLKTWLLEDR